MLSQKICDIACDIACDITKISHIPVVDRCNIDKKCAISHAISQKIAISHAISHEISHRDLLLTTQNMRYRMRYRIRYRLRCDIACDIVCHIACDIPMMRYRTVFLCDIVYDILTCACFVCLPRLPLRPCSRSSCSSCLVVCIAELQVDDLDASLRGLAALGTGIMRGCCPVAGENGMGRPACLVCRLGQGLTAHATVSR